MVFDENPLSLQRWVVLDAQGQRTEVRLSDHRTGLALERGLFRAPRPSRQPGAP
jgi:outer membrane lipoprotein-sorting protein